MHFQYGNVLVFLIVAAAFVGVVLLIGRFFRPYNPDPVKKLTYECGERPIGSAWINFNSRFFLIALIFLIFEVEVVFIYPVAAVFRNWILEKRGMLALVEILIFVLILIVGLVYAWVKGDLNWIRPTPGRAKGAKDV